jgi:hypothetical protein
VLAISSQRVSPGFARVELALISRWHQGVLANIATSSGQTRRKDVLYRIDRWV